MESYLLSISLTRACSSGEKRDKASSSTEVGVSEGEGAEGNFDLVRVFSPSTGSLKIS